MKLNYLIWVVTSKLDYKITSRNDIKRVDIMGSYYLIVLLIYLIVPKIFNLDKGVIYKNK